VAWSSATAFKSIEFRSISSSLAIGFLPQNQGHALKITKLELLGRDPQIAKIGVTMVQRRFRLLSPLTSGD